MYFNQFSPLDSRYDLWIMCPQHWDQAHHNQRDPQRLSHPGNRKSADSVWPRSARSSRYNQDHSGNYHHHLFFFFSHLLSCWSLKITVDPDVICHCRALVSRPIWQRPIWKTTSTTRRKFDSKYLVSKLFSSLEQVLIEQRLRHGWPSGITQLC